MPPFTNKILFCEKKSQEIPEDYYERSEEYKKNYPIVDFPKYIHLKIDWDFDGEFISSYWNNQYINTNGIFETQTFTYRPVNSVFEFEKPKPGPAGKDPYYERILFTLYDFNNMEGMDYTLLIKYLVTGMGEDAIYKCFEPTKGWKKGDDGIYRFP